MFNQINNLQETITKGREANKLASKITNDFYDILENTDISNKLEEIEFKFAKRDMSNYVSRANAYRTYTKQLIDTYTKELTDTNK